MDQHFTAWLVIAREALTGTHYEVEIVEDEYVHGAGWERAGAFVFEAATSVDIEDGDHEKAKEEAEELMRAAGWHRVERWCDVDTGYAATVERS